MSVIENILYGLISGLTEFLPVSGSGHQALLHHLFGVNTRVSLQDLLVHIGVLLSAIVVCRDNIARLRWEQSMATTVRRNKSRRMDTQSHYELRLLRSAIVPMLMAMIIFKLLIRTEYSLSSSMWLFIVNGVILLIAEHMRQGNRDAKTMTGFDGILVGVATATAALPGLSGTGMTLSYTTARGADIQKSTNWVILLVIPAMVFAICGDIIYTFSNGFGTVSFLMILGSVLAGVSAFCGGFVGISILRLMVTNTSVFQFSYYSFGLALLSFMLYLFT
ncbi:MAG: undecaprenyl-diphosphate phosphatase [Oscillospiraceae bacterium]|nr:undecaprenyl-diphosphate phosphatase [Oscillospiraceae bacterium]